VRLGVHRGDTVPDHLAALDATDPEIAALVRAEETLQTEKVRLIASENYVSEAVLEATGTVLTNKYSEGYPGKRYYEGQQVIDQVETLAINRAKAVFGVDHANVQPYSGSPANLAVYLALANVGDTVMGMALPMGGHLTHGWSVSATGTWFHAVQYNVGRESGRVDMDEVREIALRERPKLIFCGGTAIPRTIDFPAFAEIAREVDAVLVADIAHIAGLIAGGAHPSPVGHAGVISTTRPFSLACKAVRTTTRLPVSPSPCTRRSNRRSATTPQRSSPTRKPWPRNCRRAASTWYRAALTTTSS
jgi:glycine hydroxymethyltransferase